MLITFSLTILVDLVVAVNIGMIVAILHFLLRMASSVEIEQQTEESLQHELPKAQLKALPDGVLVYSLEGPFFFGAVELFEEALAHTHTDPRVLIIRLRWVPYIDITGLQTLETAIENLKKRGIRVMLTEPKIAVKPRLEKAGIASLVGKKNIFKSFADALKAC